MLVKPDTEEPIDIGYLRSLDSRDLEIVLKHINVTTKEIEMFTSSARSLQIVEAIDPDILMKLEMDHATLKGVEGAIFTVLSTRAHKMLKAIMKKPMDPEEEVV